MENDMAGACEHLFAKRQVRNDKFGPAIIGQKCCKCGAAKAKNLRTGIEVEAPTGEFSQDQQKELLNGITLPFTL